MTKFINHLGSSYFLVQLSTRQEGRNRTLGAGKHWIWFCLRVNHPVLAFIIFSLGVPAEVLLVISTDTGDMETFIKKAEGMETSMKKGEEDQSQEITIDSPPLCLRANRVLPNYPSFSKPFKAFRGCGRKGLNRPWCEYHRMTITTRLLPLAGREGSLVTERQQEHSSFFCGC